MGCFETSDFGECFHDVLERDLFGADFEVHSCRLGDVVEEPEGVGTDVFECYERDFTVNCEELVNGS